MGIRQLSKIIELGPRQRSLFESDQDVQEAQERLMACVIDQVAAQGQVALEALVQHAAPLLQWTELSVLQQLFWLCQDLAIDFRRDSAAISTAAAKQYLLEDSDLQIMVTLNRPVADDIFQGVLSFWQRIGPETDSAEAIDQVQLARRWVHQIYRWQQVLARCRDVAHRPGFPGKSDIEASLQRLERIVQKQESHALITACYENLEDLNRLGSALATWERFFIQQPERWQLIVDFAQAADSTLPECGDNAEVVESYRRLRQIISSIHPYEAVDEAEALMRTLKAPHDAVVAQKTIHLREKALARLKTMIEEMKSILDQQAAPDNLRNQALYPLRTMNEQIVAAASIGAIERHLREAGELFDHHLRTLLAQIR